MNYLPDCQFTLKIFYNDVEFEARDFDLLPKDQNPSEVDKVRPIEVFEKDSLYYRSMIKGKPHPHENNIFDNSMESVHLAKEVSELLRFFLRGETEKYIYWSRNEAKGSMLEVSDEEISNYLERHPERSIFGKDQIKTYVAIEKSN